MIIEMAENYQERIETKNTNEIFASVVRVLQCHLCQVNVMNDKIIRLQAILKMYHGRHT